MLPVISHIINICDYVKEKTEKGNFKFRQYQPGYGYDLEKSLDKLSIAGEKAEDRVKLLKSLDRGNLEPVGTGFLKPVFRTGI